MRGVSSVVLAALAASRAYAGEPLCCRLFGFDASSLLGPGAAMCGRILDANERHEAEFQALQERRRATQCALDAQAQGRAFVYTYRLLIAPDVDMVYQVVFGTRGERLLLRMGLYRGENIRTTEACATLTVQADGQVAKQGCRLRQGLLD
jgi:hypothetical protein